MSKCDLCQENYDLEDHQPILCKSRFHTRCITCIKNMIEANGAFVCPDCKSLSLSNEIVVNQAIISELEKNSIICFNCSIKHFCFIDPASFEALCASCSKGNSEDLQVSKAKISKKFKESYYKYKNFLSLEMKSYLRKALKESLKTKLFFIHIVNTYVTKGKMCLTHPQKLSDMLKKDTYKLCCSNCVPDGIPVDSNNLIQLAYTIYIQFIQSGRLELPYGSFLHYIYFRNPENIWAPVIEGFLMSSNYNGNLKTISCMFCSKGFCVGEKMPYKINCRHYICKSCLRNNSQCRVCNIQITSFEYVLDPELYKLPECKNSKLENEIALNNLPYHSFCDHIICGRCSANVHSCADCFGNNDDYNRYQYQLKIHKRYYRTLKYLTITMKCWNCFLNVAKYLYDNCVYCEACSANIPQKYELNPSFECDKTLIDWYKVHIDTYYNKNSYFESFSLNRKLRIICSLYKHKQVSGIVLREYVEIRELKRSELTYPINNTDVRYFNASNGTFVTTNLVISSPNIKLCGLKLAGSIELKPIDVIVILQNSQRNQLIHKEYKINGSSDYIYFDDFYSFNEYNISIGYSGNLKLFTGKPPVMNVFTRDGASFTFNDEAEFYSGTILGVLYFLEEDYFLEKR